MNNDRQRVIKELILWALEDSDIRLALFYAMQDPSKINRIEIPATKVKTDAIAQPDNG